MQQLMIALFFCLLFASPLTLAQTCNEAVAASAPDSRFTIYTDGTVLDEKTGLIWMRCALGQTWDGTTCTGIEQGYNWPDALQAAEGKVYLGLKSWRVPNIKELDSLVEQRCYDLAINVMAFPNATKSSYWSSTSAANAAWSVDFFDGVVGLGEKYFTGAVRLVRGGQ